MLEKIVTGRYLLTRRFFVPEEVRTKESTSDNIKMITRTSLPNYSTQTQNRRTAIIRGQSGKLYNGARYK